MFKLKQADRAGAPASAARNPSRHRIQTAFGSAVAALAVLGGTLFSPPSRPVEAAGGPPDASVAAWNDALERAFGPAGQTPAEGFTYIGLMHYAIFDAVVTVKGGYQPLFYKGARQPNASAEAAVAAAARGVMVKLLPKQSAIFEDAYTAALNGIPDGAAKSAGIKVGEGAAQAVLALPISSQIALGQPFSFPGAGAPGVYEPTSPPPASLIGVWLSQATPVFLGSKGQFRPGGQPALTSQTYADDFNEVKSVGAKNSTTRTQAQTDQAMLWSEPAVQQALRSMRTFINDRNLDIVDAARFSAMIGGTYEEGMLGCFDAKYALPAWRPVTAIRHADTDGNPATERDESWEPLLGTPNHPEYPSAHSCVTVGVAKAVETFLGSAPFSYTITSVAGRPSVTFTSATDLAKHVGEARIYSGIHFRQATIDGALLGRQVASLVAAKFVPAASGGAVPLPPNTGTNGTGTRDGANTAVIGGVLLVAFAATGALWYRRRTVAP